jgi:HSP20 family protein
MTLVQCPSVSGLKQWEQEMESLLSTINQAMPGDQPGRQTVSWTPRTDVVEAQDHFKIEMELAGVKKEDIKINLEKNSLSIEGEKQDAKTEQQDKNHQTERIYGSFSRTFALHNAIKADEIKARFENGVLEVILPKAEEAKAKVIPVA